MSTQYNPKTIEAHTLSNQMIQWRRHFHQNPELSFQEYETSKYVAEVLSNIPGIKVVTGIAKTGIVGTLTSGEGPTIAIRADMDALPILEANDHPFRSRKAGVMHACGHDAHTSVLLGAAHILAEKFKSGEVQGTVKLIFQPAEENPDEMGISGAPYMIQAGVLENTDAVIALHMDPENEVGVARVNNGYSMASVDVFNATISGTGGHAGYPHLGTDPIWMLGPVLQTLYGITTRKVSPLEEAVVSVTQIHGGTASNIIPTDITIQGTIRSYNPELREYLISEVEKAFSIVSHLGGNYNYEIIRGEPALNNDKRVNRWLTQTIKDLYPDFKIKSEPFGLGGEDFGHMTQMIPGSMFFLGCALNDGIHRDLHTPIFDIDENCLSIGANVMAETAVRYLNGTYTF